LRISLRRASGRAFGHIRDIHAIGVTFGIARLRSPSAASVRSASGAENLLILNHRDRQTGISMQFIAIGDYVDLAGRQTTVEALVGYGSAGDNLWRRRTVTRVHAVGDAWPLRDPARRAARVDPARTLAE
jgi:hypothetical protein